jgi:hypothetical protein
MSLRPVTCDIIEIPEDYEEFRELLKKAEERKAKELEAESKRRPLFPQGPPKK